MAASVRLQHLSYPKRSYDLLVDVSDQKSGNKDLHLPITHSVSSAMSTSFRQPKKLRVSFETQDIASPYASPVQPHPEKSPRRKRRRLDSHHESKRFDEPNLHTLLPPSPPLELDKPHAIKLRKYDEDYHHSPLLTPKDDDDDDEANNDENDNENDHGSATGPKCYFPDDKATHTTEMDQNQSSDHTLDTNSDYLALHATLRSLNSARTQIHNDISTLASMLLFHAKNTDKAVAVEFFTNLIEGKLSLPRPTKIPSVPLIDWGEYHPYFALTGNDFNEATAFRTGPMNLAVHMFGHANLKRR